MTGYMSTGRHQRYEDVADMRRCLLVMDADLLTMDEELHQEPINYLVARQAQEPCEVVVLSLADTAQAKQSRMEFLLFAATAAHAKQLNVKFPVAPRSDHDVSAAAEHRLKRTVRHLTTIGCTASGIISDENLVKAVHAETAVTTMTR